VGYVDRWMPKNSIYWVALVIPMSLEVLNSIPRSDANVSIRVHVLRRLAWVDVDIKMSSM
jgi:hypothetical protein